MEFKVAFGDIVRELRTERHLTLRKLSSKSNVALGYISEIERGHKDASSSVMGALASGLGVPLHQIVVEAGYRMVGIDDVELIEEMMGSKDEVLI